MTQALQEISPEALGALAGRIEALERKVTNGPNTDKLSMVVFSGELDKLLAAFVIATGAAACGMNVSMFFTFWATAALKKRGRQANGKSLVERMFGWMLPGGFGRQKLSKLDMYGMGRRMMAREMAKKNGHGFGLHSSALAANELGGTLSVRSEGSGQGATFTLELPLSLSVTKVSAGQEQPVPPVDRSAAVGVSDISIRSALPS